MVCSIVLELIMNNTPWCMCRPRVLSTHCEDQFRVFEERNFSLLVLRSALRWHDSASSDQREKSSSPDLECEIKLCGLVEETDWAKADCAHDLKELAQYWSQGQPPSETSIVAHVVGDRGTRPPVSHIARPPGPLFPSRHGRKGVACLVVCE